MKQPITPTTVDELRDCTPAVPSRKTPYVPPRVIVYGNVTDLTGGAGGALFDGGGTNDSQT